MEQYLTSYVWFTGLLVITVLIIDTLLAFKFRRYFKTNGFGVVTMTLLSFVISHAIGAFTFAITSLVVIATNGKSMDLFYPINNVATYWLLSSALFHIAGLTLQRILSLSFGARFVTMSRSTLNTSGYFLAIWLTTFIITSLCVMSSSASTHAVYAIGFFLTGLLTVFEFFVTIEISTKFKPRQKKSKERNLRITLPKKSRKTFSLFSGLIFSFVFFNLPTVIPILISSLQNHRHTKGTTILVISLWILIGVVFNSIWIFIRLTGNVSETSSFYAHWSLKKSRENLTLFLSKVRKSRDIPQTDNEFLLSDSECVETENEYV